MAKNNITTADQARKAALAVNENGSVAIFDRIKAIVECGGFYLDVKHELSKNTLEKLSEGKFLIITYKDDRVDGTVHRIKW
ncbi:hypothetical protein [Hufsiella ginkgonis]|uniref:Uncharacterized protein n=1 Tax=Hufsiella ginkgonis TaxID=2695274 RepID=A0A7K1Y141_9SPHI|nr:hypothetical protein [Hufsiella ginkgonis]MXV16827.1 hypothetical protein [Hufsiella ginkgonis]